VQTIERTSGMLRVVGFALLPLFLDPKAGAQPVSRSIQDYVLNQGAFQVMGARVGGGGAGQGVGRLSGRLPYNHSGLSQQHVYGWPGPSVKAPVITQYQPLCKLLGAQCCSALFAVAL
jgi:hypothetical protein